MGADLSKECRCVWGLSELQIHETWKRIDLSNGFCVSRADVKRFIKLKQNCGLPGCVFLPDKMDENIDVLQFLCAICMFSCMLDEDKMGFIFNLFDFEKRGSLGYEELFLALDCTAAGLNMYGGFEAPTTNALEKVLDFFFESAPEICKEVNRLSRYTFQQNRSVRMSRWMHALVSRLGTFSECGIQDPTSDGPETIEDDVSGYYGSDDTHRIAHPHTVFGCNDAFYMKDGSVGHIAGSVFLLHPSRKGSTVIESADKPGVGWYHSSKIICAAYTWDRTNCAVTACRKSLIVWDCATQEMIPRCRIKIFHPGGACCALAMYGPFIVCAFDWGAIAMYKYVGNETVCITTNVNTEPKRILTVAFINTLDIESKEVAEEAEFVACGRNGFVEFHRPSLNERRRGHLTASDPPYSYNGVHFQSAAYHTKSKFLVMGATDGNLHVWDGMKLSHRVEGHPGQGIQALHVCARGFCTAGDKDGQIKLWSINVQPVAIIDSMRDCDTINPGITSICWSYDGGKIAAVTRAGEMFQLCGISGANLSADKTSPFTVGHTRITASYKIPDADLLLTVGADCRLKMWDFNVGKLISTCDIGMPGICVRTAPIDENKAINGNAFTCAVGLKGGCVVIERSETEQEKKWTQVFSYEEEGWEPKCIALSPCKRFLAVSDRIFDLQLGVLHGICPTMTTNPDNFRFTKCPKRGHWRLHVEEEVFDLVVKTFFHDKGINLVKEETLVKEAKKAEKQREKLEKKKQKQKKPEVDEENEERGDETEIEQSIWIDANAGCLFGLRNENIFTPCTEREKTQDFRFQYWQASLVQNVQGCKGAWNDSIVSTDKLLIYSACDILIVIYLAEEKKQKALQMYGQIYSLAAACIHTTNNKSDDNETMRVVAADSRSVGVFDVHPSSSIAIKEVLRLHFEWEIFQVTLEKKGRYLGILGKTAQIAVYDFKGRDFVGISHLFMGGSKQMLHKPQEIPARPEISKLPQITFWSANSSIYTFLEIRVGLSAWATHRIKGRDVLRTKLNHVCPITCVDNNWVGDAKGSLYELVEDPDTSLISLKLLAEQAHDNGPVICLRDRVTGSKQGIIRVWSEKGDLLETVNCSEMFSLKLPSKKVLPIQAQVCSVSRSGAVLNGHRVVDFKQGTVYTSTHQKICAKACTQPKASVGSMIATIGETDLSVCIWEPNLKMIAQTVLMTAPRGATCTCCQFSHSGERLAVGTAKGTVHILRVPDIHVEIALIDCGGSSKIVKCLAWAPDKSEQPTKSENNRLIVARKDGTVHCYDYRHNQIKKPISSFKKLTTPPARMAFAENCELFVVEDSEGNQVYADSVSANHIPEENMDLDWVFPPVLDSVNFDLSVLKQTLGDHQSSVTLSERKLDWDTKNPWGTLRDMMVMGVNLNEKCLRSFNSSGQLVYSAGNMVVEHDIALQTQRILHEANGHVLGMAFDDCHADRDLCCIYGLIGETHYVTIFNSSTQAIIKTFHLNLEVEGSREHKSVDIEGMEDSFSPIMDVKNLSVTSQCDISGGIEVRVVLLMMHGDMARSLILLDSSVDIELRLEIEEDLYDICFLDWSVVMGISALDGVLIYSMGQGLLELVETISDKFSEDVEPVLCKSPGLVGDTTGGITFVSLEENSTSLVKMKTNRSHVREIAQISLREDYPSSGMFVSVDVEGDVRMWKGRTTCILVKKLVIPTKTLCVNPWHSLIVTDSDEIIVESYFEDNRSEFPFNGHTLECTDYTFDDYDETLEPGTILFTASKDGTVIKWDTKRGKRLITVPLDEYCTVLAACIDKLFLVVDSTPIKLVVMDTLNFDIQHEIKLPSQTISRAYVSAIGTNVVHLVDESKQCLYTLDAISYKLSGPLPLRIDKIERKHKVSLRGNCVVVGVND